MEKADRYPVTSETASPKQPADVMTPRARLFGFISFVVLCLGAGGLGAIATTPEIAGWYRTLAKPSWNPPDYVFGPVWTTLYVSMAIAAWLVWKPAGFTAAATPLSLFALQLALNVAWSWVFFGMHQPGWAFFEVLVLWLAILATTVAFFRCSRIPGYMMLPYLAWVSFAAALNFCIWRINGA
jgi:tryptophan-rich sensory protein